MKKIYNPFEIFSEKQLLITGTIVLILGSCIGFLFKGRFDGIVDLHFMENVTFSEVLVDNLINTLVVSVFLFLLGRFINSKTRIIDVLNTSLIARIPFYVLPFFNTNNKMIETTDRLLEITSSSSIESLTPVDLFYVVVFGILALLTLVWFSILLWNGFKVATNAKGTKAVVLFITVVLLAEIVSKYIITQFN
jgi:hypothetical protein